MSDARGPVALGVDVGTSGVRVVAIDGDAKQLAVTRRSLPVSRTSGATHSQEAASWWVAMLAALRELPAPVRGRARALSLDATSGTLLLSAADGSPLGPALMYDDSSGAGRLRLLADRIPAASVARSPASTLARLLQLLAAHASDAPCLALHQADWLLGGLGGRFGDSDENNALKLGYDPVARAWPAWLREVLPGQVALPRVHPVGTTLGSIAPAAADAAGLPRDLDLVAGTTDANAAVLATGATAVGDAVTSLGTTLVLKVVSRQPVNDPASGVYSHRLGDLWLAGGASNSGGGALLHYFDRAELAPLSAALQPETPTGLAYYPLPGTGERFPYNDPTMPSRVSPRPADRARFLQAMLEGIAAIEARGYRRLQALGAPYPRRVLSVGGGAANRAWGRIRARALGVPEAPAPQVEAAYGAALLALRALAPEPAVNAGNRAAPARPSR